MLFLEPPPAAAEVWVETPGRDLRVALDGRVVRLSPPLHYRIRPGDLRVLVPPPPAADSVARAAGP